MTAPTPEKAAPIPAKVLALAIDLYYSLNVAGHSNSEDSAEDIPIIARAIMQDRAALEASASEGERRGWLSAVDALDEMAKVMDEKAESLRSPIPFDPATTEEADAATTGWVLEQAAKLLRERALIPEAPAREGE